MLGKYWYNQIFVTFFDRLALQNFVRFCFQNTKWLKMQQEERGHRRYHVHVRKQTDKLWCQFLSCSLVQNLRFDFFTFLMSHTNKIFDCETITTTFPNGTISFETNSKQTMQRLKCGQWLEHITFQQNGKCNKCKNACLLTKCVLKKTETLAAREISNCALGVNKIRESLWRRVDAASCG